MKLTKRLFALVLALTMVLSWIPNQGIRVHAAEAEETSDQVVEEILDPMEETEEILQEEPSRATLASGTCGSNLTWKLDTAGTLTISGSGSMKNYPYAGSAPWYSYRNSIKTLVVQPGATSIGDLTFYGCSSLERIAIPDSVTSIGAYAFEFCSSLGRVTIGGGVTSIGDRAFLGCSSLASVTLPKGVISIGDSAFYCCSSLESIAIPDSVTSIGESVFSGSGLKSIAIPGSVTSISYRAFYGCSSLESVTIGSGVISIDEYVFYDCSNLESITIGNGVTSIGHHAFSECSSLERIAIPDSVTSIDNRAFSYCSSLESVIIGDSVTSIGEYVFYDCSSLESITIPGSVTSIGEYAFYNCSSLTDIYITDIAAWLDISFGDSNANPIRANYSKKKLYLNGELITDLVVPEGVTSIGEWAFYNCSNLISVTIPDSVTIIEEMAFGGSNNLERITIGNGVTSIGGLTFSGCSSLKSVIIPDSVTSVGDSAFSGCNSLESVTFGDGVTTIEMSMFEGCSSLKNVTLPANVTTIDSYAFSDCSSLESITIPASVTSFGSCPFEFCTSLEDVYYGGTSWQWSRLSNRPNVTYVHYSCTTPVGHWQTVTVPGTCQTAGYSYERCTCGYERNRVALPGGNHVWTGGSCQEPAVCSVCGAAGSAQGHNYVDGVCTVCQEVELLATGQCGDNLFWKLNVNGKLTIYGTGYMEDYYSPYDSVYAPWYSYRDSIRSVVIESGVTTMGAYAFYQCTSLKSVILQTGINNIGDSAFWDCTSLESIVIPDSVYSIDHGAFYGCTNLTNITIPDGVTSINGYTFFRCTSLKNITIPEGARGIEDAAFAYCSNLESIVIPDSVTQIDHGAFEGCSSLESITIPASVTIIGDFAFDGCSSLESIMIPASVTIIGGWAFDNCSSLEDVYYGGTSEQWTTLTYRPSVAYVHYSCTEPEGHWTHNTVDVTCEEDGYTCEGCPCGYERNKVTTQPATGHDYNSEVVPPTETEQGYTNHTCSNCGHSYQDEFVPALTPPAVIGGQPYATITEALEAAQPGDTVQLASDVDASGETLILRPGVTLHLGAYDLIADGFIGFNGSILDATRYSATGDYGKLIVPKENLVLSGGQAAVNGEYDVIPVWNGEDAYILANALVNDTEEEYGLKIDEENKTIRFSFVHKVGGSANNAFFKDGTGDNALKIIIRLEWASGNGVAYQDFVYNDDFVGLVSGGGYNYSFVLNNYDILNIDLSNLKVTAMILTDAGTITTGQVWTQANAIE